LAGQAARSTHSVVSPATRLGPASDRQQRAVLILPGSGVAGWPRDLPVRDRQTTPRRLNWRYGYQPLLLESFVKFHALPAPPTGRLIGSGSGQTQGRGKLEKHHRQIGPRKEIWIYPLHPKLPGKSSVPGLKSLAPTLLTRIIYVKIILLNCCKWL